MSEFGANNVDVSASLASPCQVTPKGDITHQPGVFLELTRVDIDQPLREQCHSLETDDTQSQLPTDLTEYAGDQIVHSNEQQLLIEGEIP